MQSHRPARRGGPAVALALVTLVLALPAIALADGSGGVAVGTKGPTTTTTTTPTTVTADPLRGGGMWIWNISSTERGDATAIGAKARKAHLSFVVVKAANGTQRWPGFTAAFVGALHAQGLKVCGYQRVMSTGGGAQARILASQVRRGADCAVIDAESELEGRYTTAREYMKTLRAGLGRTFPIALTSFPWVGYHPAFPYSVFLAPGAAQFNMPQIYWKDIGVSVDTAFANTYPANSVYGRPIRPIGQLYGHPSSASIQRFRQLAGQYGSTGSSWWVWEEAAATGWATLDRAAPATGARHAIVPPTLAVGADSDLVRWARIRLKVAGLKVNTKTNAFTSALRGTVLAFQGAHGLPLSGRVDPTTWARLVP